jgi:hypothetical protein
MHGQFETLLVTAHPFNSGHRPMKVLHRRVMKSATTLEIQFKRGIVNKLSLCHGNFHFSIIIPAADLSVYQHGYVGTVV